MAGRHGRPREDDVVLLVPSDPGGSVAELEALLVAELRPPDERRATARSRRRDRLERLAGLDDSRVAGLVLGHVHLPGPSLPGRADGEYTGTDGARGEPDRGGRGPAVPPDPGAARARPVGAARIGPLGAGRRGRDARPEDDPLARREPRGRAAGHRGLLRAEPPGGGRAGDRKGDGRALHAAPPERAPRAHPIAVGPGRAGEPRPARRASGTGRGPGALGRSA